MQTTPRETAEAEFVERMRADPSAGWIHLDPPPPEEAVEGPVSRGHFERRGDGRYADYRWTPEGHRVHGMTGDALDRLAPLASGPSIAIWRFHEAPQEMQDLSPFGGDEDWIAVVPLGMEVPDFIGDHSRFGICDTHRTILPSGETVLIASHA